MDVVSLVVGVALLAITLYLALGWRREADWLQWWSRQMSEDGRPWWRRGHLQLNKTQAAVLAWVFILAGGSLAVAFIAMGLGA